MNSVRSAMMREALVLVLVILTTVAGRPFKAGEGWPACGNRACQENEIEGLGPAKDYVRTGSAPYNRMAVLQPVSNQLSFASGVTGRMTNKLSNTLSNLAAQSVAKGFGPIIVNKAFAPPPFGVQTLPDPDLHNEGRAVNIATTNEAYLGSIAELAITLGFDFVAYVQVGTLHLSVLPDTCQTKVDLLFVLDGSGSMTQQGWNQEIKFFGDVIEYFDIGPDATRVAAVSYAENSRIDFGFSQHTDKASLKNAISGLVYNTGPTYACQPGDAACTIDCHWSKGYQKCAAEYDYYYGQYINKCQCYDWKQANSCRCGIPANTFYCITNEGGCSTSTMDALGDGYTLFSDTNRYGARPISAGVPKVAIVLTDGVSNIPDRRGGDGRTNSLQAQSETINAGNKLKGLNVNVFPVALGQDISETELRGFASDPVNDHFIRMDAISSMPEWVEKIAAFSCNEPGIITACDEVTTTVEQGDFRYLKRLLQGDSLVVEVDDVAGSTDVFISTTEKNPGPFDNEYQDVSGADRKVVRTTKKANQVYIALQGRGSGTATARINIYSNLYPSVETAAVSIDEGLAAGTFVYQMPSATLGASISQASLTYTLSNSMRGGGSLPFAVDRSTGRVTTTKPIAVSTASKWLFDVVATPSSSAQCVRGQVPVVVTIVPDTTTTTPDLTICTPGQQQKCGSNDCEATGRGTSDVKCTDPKDPTLEVCTEEDQVKCGSNNCEPTDSGNGNSNGGVKCTDPNDPTLEVCTEQEQTKCGSSKCVVESTEEYRRPPYCATTTTTTTQTRPVGATVPEPAVTATTTAADTTTTPDLTICTPDQQQKCGGNTCDPTGMPEGSNGSNDVKCTDPADPTVEVCTEDQEVKCGDTKCVMAADGSAPPCAGPPDLEVCTEGQQVKCGSNDCQAASGGGVGVKCTDPADPDIEVCTVAQQQKCGDVECVVSEAGIPSSCAGPPDLEVCTPSQQAKCGSNDCQPTPGGSGSSGGSVGGSSGGAGDVKCTKPGVPDLEVCTEGQQVKCGAVPCVIDDTGQASKCAGPPPPPVPPGLTFTVDPQADTGNSICREVRVPCDGMTATVYVVAETDVGQSINVTVQSSFENGEISSVESTIARDYTYVARKVITYAPGIAFDQLHLTLCGRVFTVQVLLDLLVNDGPIITGPAPGVGDVLREPLLFKTDGYGSLDDDYDVMIAAPGSTNNGMVEYTPNVGIVVSVAGDGGGPTGFVSGWLEIYLTPKNAVSNKCLHGMLRLWLEVPIDRMVPFSVEWSGSDVGGGYTVDNLEEYSSSGPVLSPVERQRRQQQQGRQPQQQHQELRAYRATENIPAEEGAVVVKVEASKSDFDVSYGGSNDDVAIATYAINSGNDLGAFAIADDGVVSVADPTVLDADDEATASFTLSIVAVDSKQRRSAEMASIEITLIDVMERPTFDLANSTEITLSEAFGGDGRPILRVPIENPEGLSPVSCEVSAVSVAAGWLEVAPSLDEDSCAVFFSGSNVEPGSSVSWPVPVTVSLLYANVKQDSKVSFFQLAGAAQSNAADSDALGDTEEKNSTAAVAIPIVFVLLLLLALLFFFLYWKPKQKAEAEHMLRMTAPAPLADFSPQGASLDNPMYGQGGDHFAQPARHNSGAAAASNPKHIPTSASLANPMYGLQDGPAGDVLYATALDHGDGSSSSTDALYDSASSGVGGMHGMAANNPTYAMTANDMVYNIPVRGDSFKTAEEHAADGTIYSIASNVGVGNGGGSSTEYGAPSGGYPDISSCTRMGPKRMCTNPAIPGTGFCVGHTCPVESCHAGKSSKAKDCGDHKGKKASRNTQAYDTAGGANGARGGKSSGYNVAEVYDRQNDAEAAEAYRALQAASSVYGGAEQGIYDNNDDPNSTVYDTAAAGAVGTLGTGGGGGRRMTAQSRDEYRGGGGESGGGGEQALYSSASAGNTRLGDGSEALYTLANGAALDDSNYRRPTVRHEDMVGARNSATQQQLYATATMESSSAPLYATAAAGGGGARRETARLNRADYSASSGGTGIAHYDTGAGSGAGDGDAVYDNAVITVASRADDGGQPMYDTAGIVNDGSSAPVYDTGGSGGGNGGHGAPVYAAAASGGEGDAVYDNAGQQISRGGRHRASGEYGFAGGGSASDPARGGGRGGGGGIGRKQGSVYNGFEEEEDC